MPACSWCQDLRCRLHHGAAVWLRCTPSGCVKGRGERARRRHTWVEHRAGQKWLFCICALLYLRLYSVRRRMRRPIMWRLYRRLYEYRQKKKCPMFPTTCHVSEPLQRYPSRTDGDVETPGSTSSLEPGSRRTTSGELANSGSCEQAQLLGSKTDLYTL